MKYIPSRRRKESISIRLEEPASLRETERFLLMIEVDLPYACERSDYASEERSVPGLEGEESFSVSENDSFFL